MAEAVTDLEVEDAGVSVLEALLGRHDAVQQLLVPAQTRHRRQQPAVTCNPQQPIALTNFQHHKFVANR